TDQLNNKDQMAAYHKMAEEIWTQTDGQFDGFVQSVGTAASLRGTGEELRRRNGKLELSPWSPLNPPFCRAAGQALIRSMESARVSSCRSGRRTSPIRLNRFPPKRPRPWSCDRHRRRE